MFALGLLAVAVFRTAEEEMAREAAGGALAVVPSVVAESAVLSGDLGRAAAPLLPFAFRKGDAVLLPIPGVPVLEGGLLGLLIAGLSQLEKKSSLGSPAGVFVPVPSLSSARSSTVTSSGYLAHSMLATTRSFFFPSRRTF